MVRDIAGSVSDTAVQRPDEALTLEEAVDKTRSEGVSSTDAVQYLEIIEAQSMVDVILGEGEGAPPVAVCRGGVSDGGGDNPQGRELSDDALGHCRKTFNGVPCRTVGVFFDG